MKHIHLRSEGAQSNPQPPTSNTASEELAPIRTVYPFAQHRLDVAGGSINYVDEGAGQAVIMLHGNPTWSFFYRRLIAALRPTHRVIVPDHMGCGLSDKPQKYPYRLADHIDNLSQLVRQLGLREIDLVVHDWGGAIGLGYAVRQEVKVRRIVLLNTAAFLSPHLPWRIGLCKLPVVGDIAIRGLNAFAGGAVFMAVERPLEPLARKGFLLPYRSYHNRIANLRFVQDIPMDSGHPSWTLLESIGQQLDLFRDTPIQILWGREDWCFNSFFLAEWMHRFPHAELHEIDGAGHYVLEDAHEYIVPAVERFLT